MKVVQGVISRTDAVVGQTGAMLQDDFPGRPLFVEYIVANIVLSFIRVGAFRGDAADFVDQQISQVLAFIPSQNLALGLAFDFPELSRHLLKRLDPVFQKSALVIRKDHQLGMVKFGYLFWL